MVKVNKKYFEGKQRKDTIRYLEKLKKEKTHFVQVLDKKFTIFPSVFSPKYFKDPEFFAKELPIKKGETFLEIGSGSGIISIFAALKGASKVTSTDINPKAVENTKYNAKLHNINLEALQGDVFEPLKFDTIFWNVPWGLVKEDNITFLEKALWDTEYKSIKKFIQEAKHYLKTNGKLLIGFSSTIGDLNELFKLLKANNYKTKIIKETISRSINFKAKFEIIEARPKSTEKGKKTKGF